MNSNFLESFCWRILRAYRQHFPIQGGGGWVEGDAMFFSFNHPQSTLFLRLTLSNPDLGRRLTVNLSSAEHGLSVTVDSTGITWDSPQLDRFSVEEIQSLENLASRFYLIALDSVDDLRLLTSIVE